MWDVGRQFYLGINTQASQQKESPVFLRSCGKDLVESTQLLSCLPLNLIEASLGLEPTPVMNKAYAAMPLLLSIHVECSLFNISIKPCTEHFSSLGIIVLKDMQPASSGTRSLVMFASQPCANVEELLSTPHTQLHKAESDERHRIAYDE